MISQTSEYALRAIVFLGNEGVPRTGAQISEATKAPSDYLSKVMRRLVRSGIVSSQRGPQGGFSLLRPPIQLTILDIVNAVDPLKRIHECPLGNKAHGVNLCTLHRTIDNTIAEAEETLRSVTVDQILGEEEGARTCPFPIPCGGRTSGEHHAQV
ncbi:MAG: Rrf2 family nitric oxide-sensitive transcriptional repressor [Verrucomicrobiales bacterium]|jgi:Rrf2 family nitric oxide-sensitive transcriptional repressor